MNNTIEICRSCGAYNTAIHEDCTACSECYSIEQGFDYYEEIYEDIWQCADTERIHHSTELDKLYE